MSDKTKRQLAKMKRKRRKKEFSVEECPHIILTDDGCFEAAERFFKFCPNCGEKIK